MSSRKVITVWLSAIIAAVLVGALIRSLQNVGGFPPNYDARDYDRRLSREAATAQPLIDALARYHAQHGQFPSDFSVLGIPSQDWVYAPHESGYTLSKILGWDPVLHYRYNEGQGHWVFEAGDGSPERQITL